MTTLFKDSIVYETYGESIAIGDVLYKSTGTGNDVGRTAGRLYKLDMTNDDRKVFYGIAKESGAAADTNKKVVTGGRFDGYSGLTPGQVVYSDTTTPGAITQTLPRPAQAIGIAIDADSISVNAALGGSLSQGTGAGTGTLNLLEDPSFEFDDAEGSITGGTASLNSVTVLPTPNNARSLELNFNNVTGSYILEKNTGAQYDSVQGLVSVWIKNAKAGVKLIPRINGADSTALSVDVKIDDKWNEYVIPAVIGITSFGFKIDVTASNAGSLFIDEAYVGAIPATMTPEVAQAEYFGGLRASGVANCVWEITSAAYSNLPIDNDCPLFDEYGSVKNPSTKIPGIVIPSGSPSGTYQISAQFVLERRAAAHVCLVRLSDGTISGDASVYNYTSSAETVEDNYRQSWAYNYTTKNTDTTIQIQVASNGTNVCALKLNSAAFNSGFEVYYYPPKSKIYSNNSMGWYVDVNIGGANPSLGTSNVSTYTSISNASLDMVINPGSQPAEIPCSGTNPSTGITCSAGDEQIGVVFDIPSVGAYEVCSTVSHSMTTGASGFFLTAFQWAETPNNAQTILQEGKARLQSSSLIGLATVNNPLKICGIFNFASIGKKTLRLMYEHNVGGTVTSAVLVGDREALVGQRDIHITVKPFINNEQITASFKQIDDAIQTIPSQNYVINGNFDFWQRGTSLGAAASTRYLADRFLSAGIGSTVAPSRQDFTLGQTDVPNNPKFFHRVVVASSAGVGNLATIQHRIEDVTKLSEKTVTFSFWAKADSNKQMSIEFTQNVGTGGSPSGGADSIGIQKFNLTSSWQKFTKTIVVPTVSGKVLGTNNNDYFQVIFWFDAGSSFNSRTDSLGHQSGTFDIAQVKLEEGSVATPFVLAGGTIQGELAACQRHYEKSYDINTAPGTAVSNGSIQSGLLTEFLLHYSTTNYKVVKRGTPIVTVYNVQNGTAGQISRFNSGSTFVANTSLTPISAFSNASAFGSQMDGTALGAATWGRYHFVADAEL